MLKEMKKEASSTLIIDLRNNSGGWTPIVLPTLYQLFGDHFLQTDMDIEFYRIISPLYMQKLQTNLQDFNQAYGTDYAYGDYTFSTDEADTTNIEQRRTDFIKNCISSVPEELKATRKGALYSGTHLRHYQRTYLQCSFPLHFLSVENGCYLVGIPSGQAPIPTWNKPYSGYPIPVCKALSPTPYKYAFLAKTGVPTHFIQTWCPPIRITKDIISMSKLRFCIYSTRLNRLLILIRTLRRRIRSEQSPVYK